MTRARTASYGVVTPPPLDRWIDAVLMLCVSLVQGVATTLGMWRKIDKRDWHTRSDASALPQAKSDIHIKKDNSTHGVILGLVPGISVGAPKGLSSNPLEPDDRNSRRGPQNASAARTRNSQHIAADDSRGPRVICEYLTRARANISRDLTTT